MPGKVALGSSSGSSLRGGSGTSTSPWVSGLVAGVTLGFLLTVGDSLRCTSSMVFSGSTSSPLGSRPAFCSGITTSSSNSRSMVDSGGGG